jgi:IclR family KDG regulon transcriptional repressor
MPETGRATGAQGIDRYRVEAVDRALVLLDTIGALPRATAAQLAETLNLNRSLVFRLLATLSVRGFVVKDENNRYQLGPRLLYLGQQAEQGSGLIDAARPVMNELLEDTNENVYLLVRDKLDVLCVATAFTGQAVRLSTDIGTRGGLHTGGAGKVMLAYAPPAVLEAVLQTQLQNFVPPSLRTRKQVVDALTEIRKTGSYVAIGEIDAEIYSVSAAVFSGGGAIAAALTIAGPISRLSDARQSELLAKVSRAAAELSQRLGSAPAA